MASTGSQASDTDNIFGFFSDGAPPQQKAQVNRGGDPRSEARSHHGGARKRADLLYVPVVLTT